MEQLPVFPRVNASWNQDGVLEVVFPNRETRFDRWVAAGLTACAAMVVGGGIAYATPAGVVVWACGWLGSLVLHARSEPDWRRTAAIVALDASLLTMAAVLAPAFIAWALGLIGVAAFAVLVEPFLPNRLAESRIRVWAERVAWGHGGGRAAVDIQFDHALPVEVLEPALVRTEDGVAFQLAPGVLLPVAEGVAGDLRWLRDRLHALAEARRAHATATDQLALKQLGRVANTSADPARPGLGRWIGPVGALSMTIPFVAPGLGPVGYVASLAFLYAAAAGRAGVTRDAWSPRTATASLTDGVEPARVTPSRGQSGPE